MKSKRLFSIWFGVGAPLFFFGALYPAHLQHPALPFLLFAFYIARVYDSFTKVCCRCPHYGTFHCGLPGKVSSYFVKRKHSPLSVFEIRFHSFVDGVFLVSIALLYSATFTWGALAWIWPMGCYALVYGPKRFHGLLPRIR